MRALVLVRIGAVGVALAAVAFVGAGCGEKIAEKAAEKVIESGADGAEVDIDTDSGSVKVSGEDGSSSYQVGDDVKLPDGFPDLPLPDDAKAAGVIQTEADESSSFTATFTTAMAMADLYDRFVGGLEDRGYTVEQKMQFTGEQGEGFSVTASTADTQVAIFGSAGEGENGNGFTVSVTPRQ
ncbi:MAG: hypothetical protein ACYC5Q_08145 [Thermoleophilia bacterium]